MSVEYAEAPEVKAIAGNLIPEHHRHLIDFAVRVDFVWRDAAAKKGGRQVLGKARRVSGLNAFLARADQSVEGEDVPDFFVIEVAANTWDALTDRQRVALVDHELSHCDVDQEKGTLVVRPHDCEEFCAVVERHGLWKSDVQALVHAAKGVQLDLLPGGRNGDVRGWPNAQVAALVDLLVRIGASADDALGMNLLDRRLAAVSAGLEDVADSTWTTVVQVLRAQAGENAS